MGKEDRRLKRCSTSTDVEAADHKGTKPLQKAESEREMQNSETDVNPKKRKKKSESKQIDLEPKKKTSEEKEMKKLRKSFREMTETMENLQDVDLPGMSLKEIDLEPKKTSESKQIDLEPKKKQKTHKKKSEKKKMKKLRKSFKEMTETMKNLHDYFMLKVDLPEMSLKEIQEMLLAKAPDTLAMEEEPVEKTEELETYECCFETEDAEGDHENTIFVRGLEDTSLSRDEIKSELRKHFESRGCEVKRVFVPIECKTGVPLGYAFINVDDEEKALKLGGGYIGGCMLSVMMAICQKEYRSFPDFTGCRHCGNFLLERRMKRFMARNSGIRRGN